MFILQVTGSSAGPSFITKERAPGYIPEIERFEQAGRQRIRHALLCISEHEKSRTGMFFRMNKIMLPLAADHMIKGEKKNGESTDRQL